MARRKTRSTNHPGVEIAGPGLYRVRAKSSDPRTGRPGEIDRIVKASSVAAAAATRQRLLDEAVIEVRPSSRVHLSTYVESWLRSKAPSLKRSTRKTYTERLQHALGVLGELYVDAITRDDLTQYRDGQIGRWSVSLINGRLRVLSTVLRDAVVEHQLAVDPTLRVSYLRQARRVDDDQAPGLTAAELAKVLAYIKKHYAQHFPLILTLALTGMRFGEATAMRWSQIDRAAGTIRVSQAQWNQVVDSTKTGVVKVVAMTPQLAEVLEGVRDRQRAQKRPGHDSGFVFPSRRGTLLFNSVLTKPMKAALENAGVVRRIRAAHGLRYSFNDLVRKVADGEVVRALTGHATAAMTTHYSSVRVDEKHAAVAKLATMIADAADVQPTDE